ncbi:DUF1344 domain-containing protein [Afifella sp. IM 167]|uniref:DUF1344 domain-containing protein n=1 Tax=Afifella sp. IM 167 TaxID=2033586 RepID=UPI001CCE8195|nr:DUF1344 domain-containing protein [Afifella sp. IM 167]MBZ8132341.1 hypothetical protein [Afifella sp. IM 167]
MREFLIPVTLAAALASGAALAANKTDTGTVRSMDTSRHHLTLSDGKVFTLPSSWSSAGYKIGDKVKVSYETQGKNLMASSVEHAG